MAASAVRRVGVLLLAPLAPLLLLAPASTAQANAMSAPAVAPPAASPATSLAASPTVRTTVDSARHEVVAVVGPFQVQALDSAMLAEMEQEGMHHDEQVVVYRFDWPVDGYLQGFRIELRDATGAPIPRDVLHHLITINYDRRELVFSAAERLFGAGKETEDVKLPSHLGVPLAAEQRLGFYLAWHNDTGHDLDGITVRVTMPYAPRRGGSVLSAVLPIYLDTYYHTAGDDTWDLPPGESTQTFEFTAPVSGRLIGVGGHLHDYGRSIVLADATTGKRLVHLESTLDSSGRIVKMGRKIFYVRPQRLEAGHRYRVTATYVNPRPDTLRQAAMGSMLGIFAPDREQCWPILDPRDREFQQDIASLRIALPEDATSDGGGAGTGLVSYVGVPDPPSDAVVVPAPAGTEPGRGITPVALPRACAAR